MTLLLIVTALPAATYRVTTDADAGPNSFRQAIIDAETATPGVPDVIVFGILTPRPWVITLATPLPTITDPVTIDGET